MILLKSKTKKLSGKKLLNAKLREYIKCQQYLKQISNELFEILETCYDSYELFCAMELYEDKMCSITKDFNCSDCSISEQDSWYEFKDILREFKTRFESTYQYEIRNLNLAERRKLDKNLSSIQFDLNIIIKYLEEIKDRVYD